MPASQTLHLCHPHVLPPLATALLSWGEEGVPAVALWVVTSRPATRSISSVKEECKWLQQKRRDG